MLGLVLARYGVGVAFALLAVVPAAVVVLERPAFATWAAIALTLAVPPSMAFGLPSLQGFRLAAAAACAALLARALVGESRARRGVPEFALVAFVAYCALSGLLTDGDASPLVLLDQLLPFALFAAVRVLSPADRQIALWVLVGATAIGSLSILYEFFFAGRPLFVDPALYRWNETEQSFFRPGGVYSSPPLAAAILASAVLLALPQVRRVRSVPGRMLVLAALALDLSALAVTFTRAPWIGAAIGTLLIAVWGSRRGVALRRSILIVAVAGAAYVTILPAVQETRTFQQGVVRGGNLAARESYWSAALPIAFNSPGHSLFGHGFPVLYATHIDPGRTIPQDIAEAPLLVQIGPHNQYVAFLVEIGLVGLGLLLLWVGACLWEATRAMRGAPGRERLEGVAAIGAVLAFLVSMVAADDLRAPHAAALFALACGLAVAWARAQPRT